MDFITGFLTATIVAAIMMSYPVAANLNTDTTIEIALLHIPTAVFIDFSLSGYSILSWKKDPLPPRPEPPAGSR